jgi:deazaflavin-dependent oxidoreductase (nitroreductase family)
VTLPRPVLRLLWALHRGLWGLSGHRVGTLRAENGAGTLFLVSTGRTSGKMRRNGLFFLEDAPNFVVVASNAGGDADPQWWRNLQVTPDATVEIGRRSVPIRARRATDEEAARLWPRLDAANPEYAAYRARTAGDIPVVILARRG